MSYRVTITTNSFDRLTVWDLLNYLQDQIDSGRLDEMKVLTRKELIELCREALKEKQKGGAA